MTNIIFPLDDFGSLLLSKSIGCLEPKIQYLPFILYFIYFRFKKNDLK